MGRGGTPRHRKNIPYGRNGRVRRNAGFSNIAKERDDRPISNGRKRIRGDSTEAGRCYGELTAIRFVVARRNDFGAHIAIWEFLCECGEVREYPLYQVKHGYLKTCGHKTEQNRVYVPPSEIDPFLAQHGRYESQPVGFVDGVLDTEYTPTVVNKTHTLIDGWIDDDIYDRSQVRAIEHVRDLWRDLRRPTHPLFDDPDDDDGGYDSERAAALLRRCRNLVGEGRWRAFENVVRWGEPGGYSGSKAVDNLNGQVDAAKMVVREVASEISRAKIL